MSGMKICGLCGLLALSVWSTADAKNNPMLKISVEKQKKTEHDVRQKGGAKDSGYVTTYKPQVTDRNQSVVLNIKIQNMSTTELKGLVVKYVVLSKDVKGKN